MSTACSWNARSTSRQVSSSRSASGMPVTTAPSVASTLSIVRPTPRVYLRVGTQPICSGDPAAPVTTTTVPPASLRPCAPQEVTVGSAEARAAAGSAVWSVPLQSHTAGDCTLPLVPPVTGLNSSGQRVSLEEGGDKASTPMPLKAGESARLTFQAPGTCGGDG